MRESAFILYTKDRVHAYNIYRGNPRNLFFPARTDSLSPASRENFGNIYILCIIHISIDQRESNGVTSLVCLICIYRVRTAARASARCCVRATDNTAAVCATARRDGRAPSATFRLATARSPTAISTDNALEAPASANPAGRATFAPSVSIITYTSLNVFSLSLSLDYNLSLYDGEKLFFLFTGGALCVCVCVKGLFFRSA